MIDVNQTRYHLLLGRSDWEPLLAEDSGMEWLADLQAISLKREVFKFPPRPGGRLSVDDRRATAADTYGNFFWIDEDRRGVDHRPARGEAMTYWPVEDPGRVACAQGSGLFKSCEEEPAPDSYRLAGMAVTRHHFLVVGTLEPEAGLLVFDLHGGGPADRYVWPVPFRPFHISARPGGGVLILDWTPPVEGAPPAPSEVRVWKLTPWFRVEGTAGDMVEEPVEAFVPADPADEEAAPACAARHRVASADAVSLGHGMNPVAMFEMRNGRLLLVDAQTGLHVYEEAGHPIGEPVDLDALINAALAVPSAERFHVHDAVYLPQKETLYVVGADGNQAFAFDVRCDEPAGVTVALQVRFLPMRRFSGKALVSHGGDVYYDYEDRWLKLVEQPRPQFERKGQLTTDPLDSGKAGTVWHRLVLDAEIPPGAAVALAMQSADRLNELDAADWKVQPAPYLRGTGSELPFEPSLAGEGDRAGTWETLVQEVKGRYARLRLTLSGSGRRTPKIFAARLWYPRFSYLKNYLPAVYQRDAESASFLERFLANVEGTFTEIEGRIAAAQILFDVDSCPNEWLDWLAGWLGAVFQSDWDAARRRLFLRHAIELYWQRGTRRGLLRLIRLATDRCVDERLFAEDPDAASSDSNRFAVRLIEGFETGASDAHRFTVSVPLEPSQSADEQQRFVDRVRRVVDREKPAHTAFDVQPYWALFRVGTARVGMETRLGQGSRFTALVLGAGRLAQGYLGIAYPANLTNRRVVGAFSPGESPCCAGPSCCASES